MVAYQAQMRYKLLNFEVYEKSSTLILIFKWSWNETTRFALVNSLVVSNG